MSTNFPTSLDSYTDKVDGSDYPQAKDVNDLQDAIVQLETKVGINSSGSSNSLDYKVNNFFVTGRKLWLYENTAPTGWTIVSVTDKVLAVKGGTGHYNVTGGSTSSDSSWIVEHIHEWYKHGASGHDESYDDSGNVTTLPTISGYAGYHIQTTSSSSIDGLEDCYTSIEEENSANDRLPAAVGIIITKS